MNEMIVISKIYFSKGVILISISCIQQMVVNFYKLYTTNGCLHEIHDFQTVELNRCTCWLRESVGFDMICL